MTDYELDMSEFLDLFVDESRQNLEVLNRGMLTLERRRADGGVAAVAAADDLVNDVFRAAHTLKGMAATMGFEAISQLSHALESALDLVRHDPEMLDEALIAVVFRTVDTIDTLVLDLAQGGEGVCEISPILSALLSFTLDQAATEAKAPKMAAGDEASSEAPQVTAPTGDDAQPDSRVRPPADAPSDDLDEAWATAMGGLVGSAAEDGADALDAIALARSGLSRLVRLDVRRLDAMLDVVSEMVIHRSTMNRVLARCDLPESEEILATHNQLLDRLQTAVLETRMVPIGQAFDRFPRMVRDLLKSQGKRARFIMEGSHVELDRTMLAAINDALVHLLRNAIDHGLESPAAREAAGKDPEGTLRLTARPERSTVVIEVVDDGRGIDVARVAEHALRLGIVTQRDLDEMSEGQVLGLLCSPGFTLAKVVTDVSGRGVGMDAVRSQIAAVRGSLEIATELGAGSTVRLRLPVNLALTDAVLVRIGEETYAAPVSAVERVVEIDPRQVSRLGDRLLLNLPDGVMPLSHACEYLGGDACTLTPAYALIAHRHDQPFAVGIDAVLGYDQIVAKPTPPALAGIDGLSAVTILAEGQVVFLLDLMQF
jgi:two-component system, chemotaxis family, sensor kinase CheA